MAMRPRAMMFCHKSQSDPCLMSCFVRNAVPVVLRKHCNKRHNIRHEYNQMNCNSRGRSGLTSRQSTCHVHRSTSTITSRLILIETNIQRFRSSYNDAKLVIKIASFPHTVYSLLSAVKHSILGLIWYRFIARNYGCNASHSSSFVTFIFFKHTW